MSDNSTQAPNATVPVFDATLMMPGYWLFWFGLSIFYCFSWLPVKMIDVSANRLGNYMAKKTGNGSGLRKRIYHCVSQQKLTLRSKR